MERDEQESSPSLNHLEKTSRVVRNSHPKSALSISQPEKGYRFSIDALILAHQVNPTRHQRILDLGTGCGIIALILARKFSGIKIYGIEIQSSLARLAQLNVVQNNLENQIKIIQGDMKNLNPGEIEGPADIVAVNPPFGKSGHSRLSHDLAKTTAKHEVLAELSDIAEISMRLLKPSGMLHMIYPAHRLAELFDALRRVKIEPKWLRTVHPRYHADANRVLVQAVKHGKGGITIGSPLYIYGPDGSYTPEIENMFVV